MEKEDIATTEGGGGEDGQERRRRVPNGRCPRLRQRGRSSPVSQSRLHPLPVLWRRGVGSPGFVWRPWRGPLAGGRVDGASGLPGTAAALGPLAQCRGRGAGRGCGPGGGCSRLSRFLSSPRLSLAALGGPPGSSFGFGALGVRDRAVRPLAQPLGREWGGEAGWIPRSVRVGSGRRGRRGLMKTSVGILEGPSVCRKSFR